MRHLYPGIQATIVGANTPIVEELRRIYPIGNNPQYPTKRIYSSKGRSWELNDIRLQLWAQHIVRIYIYSHTLVTNPS